ncbi:MAG: SDR family oxidoreductase [Verrucomicrobiae bacterium]|nr:SDR family oxidoreductase [Verrucomicrobiae bacterium]NNJ42509.1 SDR family oxidoreductase [Akkermansiaceae bacterium]
MKNKNIMVTGASRGLGLEITRRLASEGFNIFAVARKLTDELNELIHHYDDGQITFHEFDLNNTDNISTFVSQVSRSNGPLWGLVNNAAVGHDGILPTQHDSAIEELIRVNVQAPILLAKYASRSMLVGGGGRIINVSSIIASTGYKGLAVYAATKSAMIGFSRSLARDLGGAKINVNALAPGYMETEMTQGLDDAKLASVKRRSPLGSLATTSQVAGSVAFLLSDDATAITGTVLTVDAGSTA